ncbi:MAG: hypothetical protein AYK19_09165 [Theionarchaea archaeon DG-70-1]|nr:MAG: hypothetical protein AYK19_09165 [Theionarchaea archaeon DG-70-1]
MVKYSAALLMETPVKEIVGTGKKAEERGYSIIWIPDERFNKNPYVILSALKYESYNPRNRRYQPIYTKSRVYCCSNCVSR